MKLTAQNVTTLIAPVDKDDTVIWDDTMPGFGVRLRGGNRTFLVQFRVGGQQRRESLGDVRKITLEKARKAARQRFAQAQLGQDPAADRRMAKIKAAAARMTFGVVAERYLAVKKSQLRPTSYSDARRYFTRHWAALRDWPIAAIKRVNVAAVLQAIIAAHGPVSAARARANLSALFTWAMGEGLVETNPVVGTNNPEGGRQSRTRVLAEAELAVIWKACADDDFGRIVKLLMLTGCRRGEIGELKWSEANFERGIITIAASRTKNGNAHSLTLPAVALDLLRATPRREGSDNVFGGGIPGFTIWSHAVKGLNARIAAAEGKPLPRWTLHDLRRSVATHMAEEIGVQPHIIEAVLNHVSGHKGGVAGIYNRASYTRDIAAALQLWSDHLLAVIEGRKRKLAPLRKPVPA